MKGWIVALAMVLPPTVARADGCGNAASAVADATGATVGGRSVGNQVYVRLDHPGAQDLAVHCRSSDPTRGPDLFIASASLRPPPAFLALAATAASALLLSKPGPIRAAAERCLDAARRDATESSGVETKRLRFACTVNRALGGATLTIGSVRTRPY